MTLHEIRQAREARLSELFKATGLFFAFSNKQFEENKTPLKEGEKYAVFGGGGYFPASNKQKMTDGLEEIEKWHRSEIDAAGLQDEEILYELHNHECFYTGDIEDVVELFEGRYSRERIVGVFRNKAS